MVKEIMRILGISCILSGIFLFFYNSPNEGTNVQEENQKLNHQLTSLETKLDETEKELAHLQTITSEATNKEDNAQTSGSKTDTQNEKNNEPAPSENDIHQLTLRIESGTTSKDVATQLEDANIIEDAQAFNDQLKTQNLTTNIQIGVYEIDASMSLETITQLITTPPKNE